MSIDDLKITKELRITTTVWNEAIETAAKKNMSLDTLVARLIKFHRHLVEPIKVLAPAKITLDQKTMSPRWATSTAVQQILALQHEESLTCKWFSRDLIALQSYIGIWQRKHKFLAQDGKPKFRIQFTTKTKLPNRANDDKWYAGIFEITMIRRGSELDKKTPLMPPPEPAFAPEFELVDDGDKS